MDNDEFVKCTACGWVHFIVEKGGYDNCFHCGLAGQAMLPTKTHDCPIGCTIQPINREEAQCQHV